MEPKEKKTVKKVKKVGKKEGFYFKLEAESREHDVIISVNGSGEDISNMISVACLTDPRLMLVIEVGIMAAKAVMGIPSADLPSFPDEESTMFNPPTAQA